MLKSQKKEEMGNSPSRTPALPPPPLQPPALQGYFNRRFSSYLGMVRPTDEMLTAVRMIVCYCSRE